MSKNVLINPNSLYFQCEGHLSHTAHPDILCGFVAG